MATFNGGRPIDGSSGCLVISGVPGAGKTTVADLAADSLPRSAVPDADALARMVILAEAGEKAVVAGDR